MADDRKPDAPGGYSDESAELKRKLVKRMAVAGVLIAALLGGLAVIDRLGEMDETEDAGPPPITTPVPVPQKEISGAVTTQAPAPVSPPVEAPPQPDVPAQPSLPPAVPEVPAAPAATPSTVPSATPPRVISSRPVAPAPIAVPESTSAPIEDASPAPPAAAVAPPPAAKPALPRPGRGYVVQAGVFSSVELAQELHAKLVLNGIPSSLETRVQVGPFASQREAEAARAKLKALGIDGLLIPPRGRR